MASCNYEKDLYPIFVRATEALCPRFPPYDTHDREFKNFHGLVIKPDVCFFTKKWANIGITGISTVEMMAEFKIDLNDDAFIDNKNRETSSDRYHEPYEQERKRKREHDGDTYSTWMTLETDYVRDDSEQEDENDEEEEEDDCEREDSDEDDGTSKAFQTNIAELTLQGKDTLGQLTTYATAQKSAQFRKHIFSMLVFKQHARILYWDNAGLVVTERFHLANGHFAEFLGRYNKASAVERGYDVTACLLTKKELDIVRDTKVFAEDARLVKLSVAAGSEPDNFYVAEQATYMGRISSFGRSTRGFIAYSYSELVQKRGQAKKVFLKDTWRMIDRLEEHTFYSDLHKHNVPYIPSVLKALDLEGQQTMIQKLCEEKPSWAQRAPKNLRGYQHYRLLLKEVGIPLTQFSSTKHLVTVIYQALQAHDLAYRTAKILHRDISVGNIMIMEADKEEDRTAMLVDWDMAKYLDDPSPAGEKAGTWQFAAARLIQNPFKPVENILQDDLESFVHVLTWVVLRYTKNALSPDGLYYNVYTIFEEGYIDQGLRVGGMGKRMYLEGDNFLYEARMSNKPMYRLLKALKHAIAIRYMKPNSPRERTYLPPCFREEPIRDYDLRVKNIETSEWMIELIRTKLENEPWPVDDVAQENPIAIRPHLRVLKRSSEVVKHIAVDSSPKKLGISDV